MTLSPVFKSLIVAAGLAVAMNAHAIDRPLPQAAPQVYFVSGSSFDNAFSFTVTGLSSLIGGVGSTGPDSGFPIQPVTFTELSLIGPGGTVSTPLSGSSATFSFTNLAAGSYSLRLTGDISGQFGAYSIYGNLAPVPEPESYAMFVAGLGIIGAMVRRRRV